MNQKVKTILLILLEILLFWILLAFLPLKYASKIFWDGSLLLGYYLIILPILSYLLYKFLKLSEQVEKYIVILLGIIIPFIFLYYYIFIEFQKGFNLSF